MCSDTQCSTYAYQYGCGASELPAGESPTEGTTSLYEMPVSFPRVELESQDVEKPPFSHLPISMQRAQATPEHLRNYYKANQNATLRRTAPISIANLSQLPRLEVPQSQHCVPRLISDHSPLTPSPISPITPEGDARCTHVPPSGSQLYLDVISPCVAPKQGQMFACYGSWAQQAQFSPATPSTASSYDPSYNTTPLSAYPPSAQPSFPSWPQLPIGQQPPMYSQDFSSMHCNHNVHNSALDGPTLWQNNFQFQTDAANSMFPVHQEQDYGSISPAISYPQDASAQAQSCFEKQSQLDTVQSHSKPLHTSYAFDEAPPSYTLVVPDLPPAAANPQQRYRPAVCQQCGQVFTGKYGPGNCKRHVQQVHASFFERAIHQCKVCMKTYNRRDALRKHQWKKHRLEDSRPNKRRERAL